MLKPLPDPESPILVIGAASLDMVGRQTGDILPGTSNPARIRNSFGGVARNVAENLARLGHPVTLLSAVGNDQLGSQLVEYTQRSGVNTDYVLRTDKFPTGTYLAILNQKGQLNFAMDDMRAISSLTSQYLRSHYSLFKEASMVFFDCNLPPKVIETTLALAEKANLPVCGDPTTTTLAEQLKPHLHRLNIVTANSKEAAILTGLSIDPTQREQAQEAAWRLVSSGVGLAIVTIAEFGVCYATSSQSGHIPALTTEVVNPTGAGDAMVAAVMFALLNEIPEDEAVRLGVTAASLTLKHPGAVVPDLSLEMLYEHLVI